MSAQSRKSYRNSVRADRRRNADELIVDRGNLETVIQERIEAGDSEYFGGSKPRRFTDEALSVGTNVYQNIAENLSTIIYPEYLLLKNKKSYESIKKLDLLLMILSLNYLEEHKKYSKKTMKVGGFLVEYFLVKTKKKPYKKLEKKYM
jgi:hypothetical protein